MSNDQRIHRQTLDAAKEESQNALSTLAPGQRQKERLKTALVHDWLNGMRGGEIVFEALLDLLPDAEVFTLIYEPEKLSSRLRNKLAKRRVHASFLNRFQFTRERYRQLLPFLPFAVRGLNVRSFDLVVSSSHCVAKGVRKGPNAYHLSYLHAPMRYMWQRFDDYFGRGRVNFLIRWAAILCRPFLQGWDKRTAKLTRVDRILCNSNFIGAQVAVNYQRNSTTVYPFAEIERFIRPERERVVSDYYLMVTAFAPYKRVDLAIEAFAQLKLPLKIVGQGQDEKKLRELCKNLGAEAWITFIHAPTNSEIESLYRNCKAFIFPGTEDFGITPLEAMASGAPVIAYGEGGACETLTPETGVLFHPQTVDALCSAVAQLNASYLTYSKQDCENRAREFNRSRFEAEILACIQEKLIK